VGRTAGGESHFTQLPSHAMGFPLKSTSAARGRETRSVRAASTWNGRAGRDNCLAHDSDSKPDS